jgi:hypothetical protein
LVMPDCVHKIATNCIPKHGVSVIHLKDFNCKFEIVLKQTNTAAKQRNFPDKIHPQERWQGRIRNRYLHG